MIPSKAGSTRNDDLALIFLSAALHGDREGLLIVLREVALAGGRWDFLDALAASAGDLLQQLGADRAEVHLKRRLLVAAIRDANQHKIEWSNTVANVTTTKALTGRRNELNDQLATLQSQQVDIARDLELAEQDWKSSLQAGEDVSLPAERRRHRQAELDEKTEAIAQVRAWMGEVEADLRRRVPHEQLDADVAQLATDLRQYDSYRAQLDGAHQAAIDKVIGAAAELSSLVWTSRRRHDELEARAANLRDTAAQLDRPDVTVPAPASWSQPIEQALHGTGAPWRVYLTSVQNRAVEPLVRALGDAAAVTLVTRGRAEVVADRAFRHTGRSE